MNNFDIQSVVRRYGANLGDVLDIAVDCRMTCICIENGGIPGSPTSRFEEGRFEGLLEALAHAYASRMKLVPKELGRFKFELRQHINREAMFKRDRIAEEQGLAS